MSTGTGHSIAIGGVIPKAEKFNIGILANDNIFTSDITSVTSPIAFFIVYCIFRDTGKLKIMLAKKSTPTTIFTEILNDNNDLKADCAYSFFFLVNEDEQFNMTYSVPATITKLTLVEVS